MSNRLISQINDYVQGKDKEYSYAWILKCPSCKKMGATWMGVKEFNKLDTVCITKHWLIPMNGFYKCPNCRHTCKWRDFCYFYARAPKGTLLTFNEQPI